MFKTHLLFGLLLSLIFIEYFRIKHWLLFLIIITSFAIIPDIDIKNSRLGKKFKITSWLINFLFGHRGILHTIFPIIILYLLFFYLGLELVALAILTGYGSHLLLDCLSKKGIASLYPISKRRIKGFIKVNGLIEKLFFVFILILFLFKLFF